MELTTKHVMVVVLAAVLGCSGSVSGGNGSADSSGSPSDGGAGAAGSDGSQYGGTGGSHHPHPGGSGGSAPFTWDHKCACKNWTDPSNYPTKLVSGCVTDEPCEAGKVCCAISCVAPYPGVCDWRNLNLTVCQELSKGGSSFCCYVFFGKKSVCVAPDMCAPDGVLERRELKAGDKYYPMCNPPPL